MNNMKLSITKQRKGYSANQIICTKNCKYVQLDVGERKNFSNNAKITLFCMLLFDGESSLFGELSVDISKKDEAKDELNAFCNGLAFEILNDYESDAPMSLTQRFQNFVKSEPWDWSFK